MTPAEVVSRPPPLDDPPVELELELLVVDVQLELEFWEEALALPEVDSPEPPALLELELREGAAAARAFILRVSLHRFAGSPRAPFLPTRR